MVVVVAVVVEYCEVFVSMRGSGKTYPFVHVSIRGIESLAVAALVCENLFVVILRVVVYKICRLPVLFLLH